MIYKYFAYKEGPYWRIQDLLSMEQCRTLLQQLQWKYEVFASIQDYDQHGNVTAAPIFFDLDGEPGQVHADAKHLVQACEFTVAVTPRIYFSGNKGFHLVIERKIEHPRAHELIRDFARELADHLRTVDPKVYRTRSMFRVPGSPASKKGTYKIELRRAELFDLTFQSIRDLAATQRFIETDHDPSKLDEDVYQAWYQIAVKNLPDYKVPGALESKAHSLELDFTPCLRTLLANPAAAGERNATAYILARFFRLCDLDEQSAVAIMLAHKHWASFEAEHGEVSKVVRSVYHSRSEPMLGCKTRTETSKLMRAYCDDLCHFSPNFPNRLWLPIPEKYS